MHIYTVVYCLMFDLFILMQGLVQIHACFIQC
jgi:hypothetical protein